MPVIAIDGAAGSGKSTLARSLARELGLPYVNTGLMYRTLSALALREAVDLDDGAGLARLIPGLRFTLAGGSAGELVIEGYSEADLTAPEVEAAVSRVARHEEVREPMRRAQRRLGEAGAVVEGRDIGTVVFPEAEVKIFLKADTRRRVERRVGEREAPQAVVERELHARDEKDALVNPFVPSVDAVVIDTTDAGPEETLAIALALVGDRLA